jgi:secreted trypsin-like serine protease
VRSVFDLKEKLLRAIEEQRVAVEKRVVGGQAADHAEYRALVGTIRGMNEAANIVKTQFDKLLDEGD